MNCLPLASQKVFFFNCYTIYTLSKQFPLTKTSYLELFEETIFLPRQFPVIRLLGLSTKFCKDSEPFRKNPDENQTLQTAGDSNKRWHRERQFKAQVPTLGGSNKRQCSAGPHATGQAVRHGLGAEAEGDWDWHALLKYYQPAPGTPFLQQSHTF